MAHFTELRVFIQARENLKEIKQICKGCYGFGDLNNQLKRSAISVVSNIAEGAGNGTNKQFVKFLNIARGSNHEVHAQLLILSDLGYISDTATIFENVNVTGKMLTKLIQCLR